MSKEIKEEIERMESLGMKPFSLLEKQLMMKGYDVAKKKIEALTKDNKELSEKEEKHIKMFASWLMDEGYLIDGEKMLDFNINDVYDYWNVN